MFKTYRLVFFIKFLIFLIIAGLTFEVFAVPFVLNYQGRILKSDGTPLDYGNVSFIFQVTNPSGSCVIYQEQVTGYSFVNSGGVFDVPIGKGTVQFPVGGLTTIIDIFNAGNYTCGSCSLVAGNYSCTNGTGTYNAAVSDGRKLRVHFYDGNGWKTISPDNEIQSVPYAGHAVSAQKLGSNVADDFLLKAGLPTCAAGTFLSYNGTALSCIAGGGGGTVTNVSSANSYLSVANSTATPSLTVNVGTTANTVAAGDDSRIVNAIQSGANAGGDLFGTLPSPTVVKIQGKALNAAAPNSGDFLKYNGTNWINSVISAATDITGLGSAATVNTGSAAGNIPLLGIGGLVADKMCIADGTASGIICNSTIPLSSQWTTAGTDIYYSSGKVGIGTSVPNSPLEVRSDGPANTTVDQIILNNNTASDVGVGSSIKFAGNNGATSGLTMGTIGSQWNGANSNADLYFQTSNAGTIGTRLYIRYDGNVGIGNTNPTNKLSVNGNGNFLGSLSTTNNAITAMRATTNTTATDGFVTFSTVRSSGTAPVMMSPRLRMYGNVWDTGTLSSKDFNGTIDVMPASGNPATAALRLGITDETTLSMIYPLAIASNGKVGIGTTSPSYTLHVVGDAGLSTGTAWTNASDRRLKDIQGDYEYGLNEVLKLHTVRYTYKKNNPLGLPSDFAKTGFIAQEVKDVIPDAVKQRKDGYLELNVDPIHWAVVNAIKDLYSKYISRLVTTDEKHNREIASLKQENIKLKENAERAQYDLQQMKRYLCAKDSSAPFCH